MNKVVSESIKFARFPLAFLIIVKHYYNDKATEVGEAVYHWLGNFSSDFFPAFVVPLFFFISGYLFCVNVDFKKIGINQYTWFVYIDKIKKRIKTLVIPYISWNLIVFVALLIVQYLSGDKIQPLEKSISNIGYSDIFRSLWSITDKGNPVDSPLWFIRDLFIICLFSPIIMLFIKHLKVYGLIIITLLFCAGSDLVPLGLTGPSYNCQFFFTLGAFSSYIKIRDKDLLEYFLDVNIWITSLIYILVLVLFTTTEKGTVAYNYLIRYYCIFSVIAVWPIVRCLVQKYQLSNIKHIDVLSTSSFFIFALHKPILFVVVTVLFSFFSISNDIVLSVFILLIPSMVYVVCLAIYSIIKRHMPFLKFLNGYRL